MGQCTSKHQQQKAVVVATSSTAMQRGPSNSSMSMASSTLYNLSKYLAENPERVGVNSKKNKKFGSFILRDSASAPAGEDLSCSATTMMSLELSDRSSCVWVPSGPTGTSSRSRSPKRSSSISTSTTIRSSANRLSPKRNISNESNGSSSRNSHHQSHNHCWAALRDTTDRDYSTTYTGNGGVDFNPLDPFGLDTLPEELAIRQQPSGESTIHPGEKKKEQEKESAETPVVGEEQKEVSAATAATEGEGNGKDEEEKQEDNVNTTTPARRIRRRSRRDWKRSSGVYQQQQQPPNKQASYRRTGTEESIDPAKLREGKESSWMALSCGTSRHGDSYSTYASSNLSWQVLTLNDSTNGDKVDLGRYQKDAMGNMHGFCFAESSDDDDMTDISEEDGDCLNEEDTKEMKENKFWETNALRS